MTRALRRALAGTLGEGDAALLCSSFDQVGEIAIIRIPDPLLPRRREIGEAVLAQASGATRVFCQASDVSGEHRTRSLELIAGEGGTVTVHREHGCAMLVDVEGAFFSPRLATERARIASLASDGETVLNMFGGVGAFSLVIARATRCEVHTIDINPLAARLCAENASRMRLAGTVTTECGDAAELVPRWAASRRADRTLMLLPERSAEFLGIAVSATRPGGTIHYYSHVHADSKALAAPNAARELLDIAPRGTGVSLSRIVRPVGPRYYQTAVDAVLPA
ncbi:MAG: class I SAM-dependent methyltransferase family protein [Thaumarchaeota archaeon]|nr:class I SAM-dependent methyltransferase family protein [Nitrososphaerota archaeon]